MSQRAATITAECGCERRNWPRSNPRLRTSRMDNISRRDVLIGGTAVAGGVIVPGTVPQAKAQKRDLLLAINQQIDDDLTREMSLALAMAFCSPDVP
jgi:hypothetical protein